MLDYSKGTRLLFRAVDTIVSSPRFTFLVMALVIMGPLLAPGRLLLLDSPLALNMDSGGYFWGTSNGPASVFAANYNSAPIAFALHILSFVLPFWVVEKLWLVLLFWLCGLGAFQLPYLHGKVRYYAGLLYALNPFTYVRFVSGQWGVLGAYALVPFAAAAFIRTLEERRPRQAVKTVLILTAIGFLQVHGLLLACLVLAALYLGRITIVRKSGRNTLPILILTVTLFLGINAFWMVRYVISGGGALHNMPVGELEFFNAFHPLDILSLRGFWLQNAYLDIANLVPVWWMFFIPLLFLAIRGAFGTANVANLLWLSAGLVLTGLLSILLAAGPGIPVFQPGFHWMWEQLPWYRAFRDSHKFVGLLALVYTYLGAFGVQSMRIRSFPNSFRPKWLAHVGMGLVLAVVVVYSLPIFGAWGQVSPTSFPAEWDQVRSILNTDSVDYNVLVLPWHMYMEFDWLPNSWRKLANPAPTFFTQPVISGDNLEIPVNRSDSSNPQSKYVELLIEQRESLKNFGAYIAPLNAKYVVLFKTADYRRYNFLREQDDLDKVYEGETIALFRNLRPTARIYSINDMSYTGLPNDYLTGVSNPNALASLGLPDSASVRNLSMQTDGESHLGKVAYAQVSPVSYRIEYSDERYLVLALPQSAVRSGWEYDGHSPNMMYLRMMPAFPVQEGKADITYTLFYEVYLPTYLLAIVSIVAAMYIYWRWR